MEEELEKFSPIQKFNIVRTLGKGCQAEVVELHHIETADKYAGKVISTRSLSEKERQRIIFQVNSNMFLSNQLQSKYFPKMFGFWEQEHTISILFQLCQQNAETGFKKLPSYCQRYNYLIVLLFDVLNALKELQSVKIVHRDIKPQNILMKNGLFKLADLGLSRVVDNSRGLTNDIGNRLGRSPSFVSGNYSFEADIWSLGIHIFYLLQNTLPFDEQSLLKIKNNPNDIEAVISSLDLNINLQASGRRSKNILSFLHLALSEMIVINAKERSSASNILDNYFSFPNLNNVSEYIKFLLVCYLKERIEYGQFYLIMLLSYHQFYKMDAKIKQDMNSNKRKICLMVKNSLLQTLMLLKQLCFSYIQSNIFMRSTIHNIIQKWSKQLEMYQNQISLHLIRDIDEILQLYKISKVRQKFVFIEWIVKLFKIAVFKTKGQRVTKIYLWDIPFQIYKMI